LHPAHALPLFGFELCARDARFSAWLLERQIAQLRATDDADWPVCRRAVAHAHAAAALSIAVALLKHSRELRDLELLRRAFGAAASFERKRLVLRAELS